MLPPLSGRSQDSSGAPSPCLRAIGSFKVMQLLSSLPTVSSSEEGSIIAPRATLVDGELDVQIITARKLEALRLVPKALRGLHLNDRAVRRFSVPEVRVETETPVAGGDRWRIYREYTGGSACSGWANSTQDLTPAPAESLLQRTIGDEQAVCYDITREWYILPPLIGGRMAGEGTLVEDLDDDLDNDVEGTDEDNQKKVAGGGRDSELVADVDDDDSDDDDDDDEAEDDSPVGARRSRG